MNKLTTTTAQPPVKHRSRLFQGILPFNRSNITNDIIGGIVLAAIGIPEVLDDNEVGG